MNPIKNHLDTWLSKWLATPGVTDILIQASGAFADCGDGLQQIEFPNQSEDEFKRWVIEIISKNNRTWDARYPFLDFIFSGEHRFHVVFPPVTSSICVSIRSHRQRSRVIWSQDSHFEFLANQLKSGKTILISGATGTGKTTLIRDLISTLPSNERILCLEDTQEISSERIQFISMTTRDANPDGFGQLSLGDLIRQALRMRPDRLILGECRGREVFHLLQALNSGHRGSLSSIHANSTRDAIRRIELLCQIESRNPVSTEFIRELVRSGLDLLVHLKRNSPQKSTPCVRQRLDPATIKGFELPGRDDRVIFEISEICGIEGNTILLRNLVKEGKWIHSKKTDSIRFERTT